VAIRPAHPDDVEALLPLLRGYCDFYGADPSDDGLRSVLREIIALPEDREFVLVAQDDEARVVGIAVCAWRWSSLRGARTIYLADLFVHPDARGAGHADALIAGVAEVGRRHGAADISWLTAPDNLRARAVYDRMGASAETYLEYELDI
jgi:GNAT superfamily N-acetyltransferase